MGTICLSYVARHPETWPKIDEQVARIKAENPSVTHVYWDFEFSPFPQEGDFSLYPCFSAFGIATFAQLHGIREPLTPALLREKYNKEWVEFACGEMAAVCGVLRDACHRHGLKLAVYSGYECWDTHWRYGINWDKLGPNVDEGHCGYGRDPQKIAATRRGLGGNPLVGGLLRQGLNAPSLTPAELLRQTVECGGGVICWFEVRWDATTLAAFARVSRTIAAVEPFLTKGTRRDGAVTVEGGDTPDSVVAYEHNGQLLILVINQRNTATTASLRLRKAARTLTQLDPTRRHDTNKLISVTVPAGDFVTLLGPLAVERESASQNTPIP
jgi:hypothetical protein